MKSETSEYQTIEDEVRALAMSLPPSDFGSTRAIQAVAQWAFKRRGIRPVPEKSETELVSEANALARQFYAMQGYNVSEYYKFYNATHPQEVACWRMAVAAYDHISGTDIEDCLGQIEDDQ